MNLPFKSKPQQQQQPQMSQQQTVEQHDAETASVMASISKTRKERDALANECERLREENAVNIRHIEQLERMLKDANIDKDYWQRHSASLHTRISDIMMASDHIGALCHRTLEDAGIDANKQEQDPRKQKDIDQAAEQMSTALVITNDMPPIPKTNDGWGSK